MTTPRFTLHYAPQTRATTTLWLMEEAGLAFDLALHDLSAKTHKRPEHLALNPAGKLPVLIDRGPEGDWHEVICDSAAICAYVADLATDAKLAPAPHDRARGRYLQWLVYNAATLEPAFADAAMPRQKEPPPGTLGWPTFAQTTDHLHAALQAGPWLLGAQFSAADILVASALNLFKQWGMLPAPERFDAYLSAATSRDAFKRAQAREAACLAARA